MNDNDNIASSEFNMIRYSSTSDDSLVDINIKVDDRINKTPSKESKGNISAGNNLHETNKGTIASNSYDSDNENSVRGSVRGSVKGSVRGSQRDQSRRSDNDGDERLGNSRLAFSNADRKLESKVMNSKMRSNNNNKNESSETKQNDKFYDRLKDYSSPISVDSDAYKNWNIAIIFLSIVTAFYTPYRISFETSRAAPWFTTLQGFEVAFDLIFIANMFLHALHFYNPTTISTFSTDGLKLRSEILANYITRSKGKRFAIDVVSSLPWEFFVNSSDLNTNFGLGALRVVRLYWVGDFLFQCESDVNLPFFVLRLLKLLMFLLLG